MAVPLLSVAWCFVWALAVGVGAGAQGGSCGEAQLCCAGRDPSCVVRPFSPEQGRPCYCDHACLSVGDCCHDFQQICGALDCHVSEWGSWSECSAGCGTGTMSRKRHVLAPPRNGGRGCPDLLQKRSCFGATCEPKTTAKANREIAMILPATYRGIRQVNASLDIRTNLRLKYKKDPLEENSREYCVVFEVSKSRKTCESLGSAVSSALQVGARACVSCETAAMRRHLGFRCQGHGADHHATRFTYLAFPQCQGRWRRLEVSEKCACRTEGEADFIFV